VTVTVPGATEAAHSSCPSEATPAGTPFAVAGAEELANGGQATGCADGTGVDDGTLSVGPSAVVFDGQSSNPNLLAGYIGVDRQDTLTLVGCDTGDYDPNAPDQYEPHSDPDANNAMASIGKDTLTAPAGPVGPTSPCSPSPPGSGPSGPCGGAQDPNRPPPGATYPPSGSPLVFYTSGAGAPDPSHYGYVGIAGDFGGNDGAGGYLQLTYGPGSGDIATGGTSKGGGGTVAVGNDGRESGDQWTPSGAPIAACQN
jgi:hypothetical protein